MRQYINTTTELIYSIKEKFNVDGSQIWKATHYLVNSQRAREIRDYALQHGGKVVTENFVPDCKTEHRVDSIIQRFGAGVILTFNKRRGDIVTTIYGNEVSKYDNVTIAGWGNACAEAQAIADSRRLAKQNA